MLRQVCIGRSSDWKCYTFYPVSMEHYSLHFYTRLSTCCMAVISLERRAHTHIHIDILFKTNIIVKNVDDVELKGYHMSQHIAAAIK